MLTMMGSPNSGSRRRRKDLFVPLWLLLLGCTGMMITPAAMQATPRADHESILHALRTAGLSSTAAALDTAITQRGFLVPPSATIFVPTNAAMDASPLVYAPTSAADAGRLDDVFSYHIVAENFPFDVLTSLPMGTQIPTLFRNNTLLVTDNNPSSFHVNDRELLAADLCTIQTVACYAVNTVFDSRAWGTADSIPTAMTPLPPPLVSPPIGAPLVPPPAAVPAGAPEVPPAGAPLGPPLLPGPAGAPGVVFSPQGSPAAAPAPPGAPGTPGAPPGTPAAPRTPDTPAANPPPGPPGAPSAAAAMSPGHSLFQAVAVAVTVFFFERQVS